VCLCNLNIRKHEEKCRRLGSNTKAIRRFALRKLSLTLIVAAQVERRAKMAGKRPARDHNSVNADQYPTRPPLQA
jgi:hypothetical protein